MEQKTIEDFCKVISKLDAGDGVKNKDIAKELNLSKITTSLLLKKLGRKGYVKKTKYKKVKLTKKGSKIAKKMHFKHRVIEAFLYNVLGIDLAEIHKEACRVEHYLSDKVVERMYILMGKPKLDPHGEPIMV